MPAHLRWVDCAKGSCIIMVVIMHSALAVKEAVGSEGLMYYLVAFAKPFRMPDFFLVSGLFLSRAIGRSWRSFIDRKVVHFAYFYLLWVIIHFTLNSPDLVSRYGVAGTTYRYLRTFIQPYGTLWFIYLLPVFFVVSKLLHKVQPVWVFVIAMVLEIAPIETGWIVIDHSAARFVYFYAGYLLAPQIFSFVAAVQARPVPGLIGLTAWAFINGMLVFTGYANLPFVSLMLGFMGAAAVVAMAALLSNRSWVRPLRYCGQHSIVVYLAFVVPMQAGLLLFTRTSMVDHAGLMTMVLAVAGIAGAIVMGWMVRGTRLSFLFHRPTRFSLNTAPPAVLQARTNAKVLEEGTVTLNNELTP